jgi:hypothetical protein
MVPLIVGAVFALAVGLFASGVGLDRDRSFYPTVTIVIALLYVLFAAMGGSTRALVLELLPAAVFIALAMAGFKQSLWIAAAALAGHGLFDLVHPALFTNPGVPAWWPEFCLAYDVVAGAYLAVLLKSGRMRAA